MGLEIRNGNNLIPNPDLLVTLPDSVDRFRTVTYTFDKANQKIHIYADSRKLKTVNASKFFADIEGLDTAFLGRAERANSYPDWRPQFANNIYYVDVTKEILTEDEVIDKHQDILLTHFEAQSRAGAFGAFKSESMSIFKEGQEGAARYRIPSLLTTKNGVTIAAIDKRNQHGSDWGNIDTVIRRSFDGGKTWEHDQVVIDLAEQPYGNEHSAFLIDPLMVQDKNSGRVFMLVDMFPETKGFFGINNLEGEGTGYKLINGKAYCVLKDNDKNQYTVRENGIVYDEHNQPTDYRVVVEGDPSRSFKDLGDLYHGDQRLGNIFLRSKDENNDSAPLTAKITGSLWLTYSDDDGKTWSSPTDITPQVKADWMRFIGTGPGNGIQLKNGNLVMPIYYTNANGGNSQSSAVIISRDGGKTWERSESPNDRIWEASGGTRLMNNGHIITESQVIELDNGDLKMFARNLRGKVFISTSKDGGYTWSKEVTVDDVLVDPYSQLSIIKYSKRINGKEIVLFANPHNTDRSNGKVWLGEVQDDGSIEWKYNTTISTGKYAYNSLSELPNGEIGLLYEDDVNGYATNTAFVRLNLQELLWKDNIIYRDVRDPENKEFSYQTTYKDEIFYKIGDGEMIKVGEGVNYGHLVVEEGTATLNQEANGDGEKQAFASVLVNPNGTLRLGSSDQMEVGYIHLNRGTLDLNGQTLDISQQNDENTGLRAEIISGDIVNHSPVPATLNYQLQGDRAILGQLGDDKGELNLTYHPNSPLASLSLLGDSVLNTVDVKSGEIAYHFEYAHKTKEMAVRTGANIYLFDHANVELKKANLERDANLVVENLQGQAVNLNATVTGAGNLVKNGEGHLNLSGDYQHKGTSNINGGSLTLKGNLGGSQFYLGANTTLAGNGEIIAPSTWAANSIIAPSAFTTEFTPNKLKFHNVNNQGARVVLGVENIKEEMKAWQHDQLLIAGDLNTENPIPVDLKLWGSKKGFSDVNNNGKYDADEGVSLIQVKGKGKLGQFELDKITAKDPNDLFNFTLVSVDKKMSSATSNQFGEESSEYYDYRLQTQLIRADGTEVDPFIPYVEPEVVETPKVEEPEVVETPKVDIPVVPARGSLTSRIPSYLVANAAMVAQGNTIQQQFAHNLWAENKKGFYVNQRHSNARYQSNLSFTDYGFDFKSQQNSTLFGGYLPVGDQTEIHVGVGFSKYKVTPNSVDGESYANYKTTSLLLAVHHEWGQNWLVNSYLGYHLHRGKISAQEGKDVAKVKGKQLRADMELGYRVILNESLNLIPMVAVGYQHLNSTAKDNLGNWSIDFEPYQTFTAQVGSYLDWHLDQLSLRVGAFYENNHTNQSDVKFSANQRKTFKQGGLGNGIVLKGELEYVFTPNVKSSLQFSHRQGVSQGKLRQSQVGLELRYQF